MRLVFDGSVGRGVGRLFVTFRTFGGRSAISGWLVVERQRAPSSEPMEFRGLADARPPATPSH